MIALPARSALTACSTAELRRIRRALTRSLRAVPGREVLELAQRLVARGDWGGRLIGYELVHHHAGALGLVDERAARRLAGQLSSWGEVDTFASYIAGPAWREGQIPVRVIRAWAGSSDRWWRRTAVVCTVALNTPARGGRGDTPRTLDICRRVMDDRDDMVVKALSWALRELSKRDPRAARAFLTEHRERLPARVLREVGNKLETGLKNPGRRRSRSRTALTLPRTARGR